jgi:hypothetical protein
VKFRCCETCLHREDELVCQECDEAEGYEFDESVIEIDDRGNPFIPRRIMLEPA